MSGGAGTNPRLPAAGTGLVDAMFLCIFDIIGTLQCLCISRAFDADATKKDGFGKYCY